MSSSPEKNFYQQLKKNVNKIQWLRIESWATQGVPDLLGTTENGVLFTIELKVTKSKQIKISPHQIAFHKTRKNSPCFILVKSLVQRPSKKSQLYLYPSFQLEQLLTKGLEPSFLVPDGWLNFEQHLLNLISPVNP
jgi:Holliday junction resolvase